MGAIKGLDELMYTLAAVTIAAPLLIGGIIGYLIGGWIGALVGAPLILVLAIVLLRDDRPPNSVGVI